MINLRNIENNLERCIQVLQVIMWSSVSYVTLILSVVMLGHRCQGLGFIYHNYTALEGSLEQLSQSYPHLTNLYTIGTSVQGRHLWVIAIGQSPWTHVPLRPHVKLIANMHGNEVVGREALLHFSEYLLGNYGKLVEVTDLLDNTVLHLLPSMNPDGFEVSQEGDCHSHQGRGNANDVDLNRNFPDYFAKTPSDPRQLETLHVMKWIENNTFALSASFHGGALLVNYPLDNYPNAEGPKESLAPDNDILRHLSLIYSKAHPKMRLGLGCRGKDDDHFVYGVTNGAAWYAIAGGMQDYNYMFEGCPDVTLEVSCCKYPPVGQLKEFWDLNRDPIMQYLQQAHVGVKGLIVDENNNTVARAVLYIVGREPAQFKSSKHGEYWRILLPGNYQIHVAADGHRSARIPFTVKPGEVTRLDVTLRQPLGYVYHHFVDLEGAMKLLHQDFPSMTRMYSIGKSVQGRDLWVMAVGESPHDHVTLRPHVKYVGNIHGNEVVSREVFLHLIEYLLVNYGKNDTITRVLDSSTIHILPSMNPDGFEASYEGNCSGQSGRANANGLDLNRNFPDYFQPNHHEENNETIQPETLAVMAWMKHTNFVLSASMHGGILLVNYPLDNYLNVLEPKYSMAPDDDVLRHISLAYSRTHPTMYLGKLCPGDAPLFDGRTGFDDGITNGAEWYPATGGMQDYSYIFEGCMEVTVEMGCCKYPMADQLEAQWNAHRESLIAYVQQVNIVGVRGLVTNVEGGPVSGTNLTIEGREGAPFRTSEHGEYWRILLPGDYTLRVSIDGYPSTTRSFQVKDQTITIAHITLDSESSLSHAITHIHNSHLYTPIILVLIVNHLLISSLKLCDF